MTVLINAGDDAQGPPEPPVYLDYNASAPLRPEAREAMLIWLDPQRAGNPNSVHQAGRVAEVAVQSARRQVAELIGCSPGEIVFTSGATEANNLALHAALDALPSGAAVVTSAIEHPSVLAAVRAHTHRGVHAHVVPVDGQGQLDLDAYREALGEATRADAALVSVMAANNETGLLTDVIQVVTSAQQVGATVHTDATQLVGRLPVDVGELEVDMLSLSAHKFGGPQGMGALYVSRRARLGAHPLLHGGGQERGWRAGTHNVAGIAGMGAAAAAARRDLDTEPARVAALRDRLEIELRRGLPQAWVNGHDAARLPGVTSLTIPGLPADALIAAMPDVAVSEGSACAAGAPEPSRVLIAMGLSRDDAAATIRFSFGHATTGADIDRAVAALRRATETVAAALNANEQGVVGARA